jgi:hypothetical protein
LFLVYVRVKDKQETARIINYIPSGYILMTKTNLVIELDNGGKWTGKGSRIREVDFWGVDDNRAVRHMEG